jgi:hypothetical protein
VFSVSQGSRVELRVAVPSRRDNRTARSIARSKTARMPYPFMVILAPDDEGWRAAAYRFQAGRLHAVLIESLDGG